MPLSGAGKRFKEVKRREAVGSLLPCGGFAIELVGDYSVGAKGNPSTKSSARNDASSGTDLTMARWHRSPTKAKNHPSYLRARAERRIVLENIIAINSVATVEMQIAAYAPDDRAMAILRGRKIAAETLSKAGGAYKLDQVRSLLNDISRQAIDKRVQDGTLLAVPGPQNRRRYPTIQFDLDGTLVEGLKETQAALPSQNPWVVLNFLIEENSSLDNQTPIDLLRSGQITLVVAAARSMGEQGS